MLVGLAGTLSVGGGSGGVDESDSRPASYSHARATLGPCRRIANVVGPAAGEVAKEGCVAALGQILVLGQRLRVEVCYNVDVREKAAPAPLLCEAAPKEVDPHVGVAEDVVGDAR